MPDTSVAIIVSASITATVALAGIIMTVIVGGRGQRKTLEHTAEQARLGREADAARESRDRAKRRYERVRGIVEPHVALAREMRSTTSAWQVTIGPASLDDTIRAIVERVSAVWAVADQRRGDFELEPGLDELRAIFGRLAAAFNVFANVARDRPPGINWSQLAFAKTQVVHAEADAFIEAARQLIAQLQPEGG